MNYFIWDLDNCLADDSWRFHLIDWHLEGDARWDRYNNASIGDTAHFRREFAATARMGVNVICTNRCDDNRRNTTKWLRERYGFGGTIMMRPRGLSILPQAMKQKMLDDLFPTAQDKKQVVAAFDDHPPILEMYEANGITGVQMKIHDVSVYGDKPQGTK